MKHLPPLPLFRKYVFVKPCQHDIQDRDRYVITFFAFLPTLSPLSTLQPIIPRIVVIGSKMMDGSRMVRY